MKQGLSVGSDRDCEAGAVYGVWGQTGSVKQGLSMGSDRDCKVRAVCGVWGQTGSVKQGLSMWCGVRQGL